MPAMVGKHERSRGRDLGVPFPWTRHPGVSVRKMACHPRGRCDQYLLHVSVCRQTGISRLCAILQSLRLASVISSSFPGRASIGNASLRPQPVIKSKWLVCADGPSPDSPARFPFVTVYVPLTKDVNRRARSGSPGSNTTATVVSLAGRASRNISFPFGSLAPPLPCQRPFDPLQHDGVLLASRHVALVRSGQLVAFSHVPSTTHYFACLASMCHITSLQPTGRGPSGGRG